MEAAQDIQPDQESQPIQDTQSEQESQPKPVDIRLVDIPVRDENTSFNLMVNFLVLAQKRGAFSLEESAKIWECIKIFQK